MKSADVARGSIKRNQKSFKMVHFGLLNAQMNTEHLMFKIIILHLTFLLCWTPYVLQSTSGILGLDEVHLIDDFKLMMKICVVCACRVDYSSTLHC